MPTNLELSRKRAHELKNRFVLVNENVFTQADKERCEAWAEKMRLLDLAAAVADRSQVTLHTKRRRFPNSRLADYVVDF